MLYKYFYTRNVFKYLKIANLFGLLLIVFLFIQLQLLSEYDYLWGFSYWLVPDSITHYELTRGLFYGVFELDELRSSAGVPLYFSLFFIIGVIGFLVANALLISICVRYFGISVLYVTFLFYPHYLQLLILPSKDLMVLVAYFLVIFYLLRDNFFAAIIFSALAFFIRDAATFVLLPLVVVSVWIKRTNLHPLWIVTISFLSASVVFHIIEKWGQEFFVVARNSAALNEISSDALRNLPFGIAYLARVFFNLTNMAFRLPFEDGSGGISVASIFMYVSGISSLVCCIIAGRNVLISKERSTQLISVFYFISLFLISLNPFVQGRYQLPMAIVCSLILFKSHRVRTLIYVFVAVILISFAARNLYIFMGIELPVLEVNLVDLRTLLGN